MAVSLSNRNHSLKANLQAMASFWFALVTLQRWEVFQGWSPGTSKLGKKWPNRGWTAKSALTIWPTGHVTLEVDLTNSSDNRAVNLAFKSLMLGMVQNGVPQNWMVSLIMSLLSRQFSRQVLENPLFWDELLDMRKHDTSWSKLWNRFVGL